MVLQVSSILFLIKAFSCIGFFVIITKPPCIAVLWALHEAGLHTASVCEYSCSWTLHIVLWLLRQSEYHCRCRAGYHTRSVPSRKHKLDCRRGILFQFCHSTSPLSLKMALTVPAWGWFCSKIYRSNRRRRINSSITGRFRISSMELP